LKICRLEAAHKGSRKLEEKRDKLRYDLI
jgi:hypothetical protein